MRAWRWQEKSQLKAKSWSVFDAAEFADDDAVSQKKRSVEREVKERREVEDKKEGRMKRKLRSSKFFIFKSSDERAYYSIE